MNDNHLRRVIKGIVHSKMKISWKMTHPQAIQDVDEFLHQNRFGEMQYYQWIFCSEWVPSEQGQI